MKIKMKNKFYFSLRFFFFFYISHMIFKYILKLVVVSVCSYLVSAWSEIKGKLKLFSSVS